MNNHRYSLTCLLADPALPSGESFRWWWASSVAVALATLAVVAIVGMPSDLNAI